MSWQAFSGEPSREDLLVAAAMWRSVAFVNARRRPYGSGTGVTRSLPWPPPDGSRLLSEGAYSHCSGATYEALVLFFGQFPRAVEQISAETLRELKSWVFINDFVNGDGSPGPHRERYTGGPGGLVSLGLGEWVEPEDAKPGDLAHWLWDDAGEMPDPPTSEWCRRMAKGHETIVTEGFDRIDDRPALWTWASNTNATTNQGRYNSLRGLVGVDEPGGHQRDFFFLDKEGRSVKIARIRRDLLLG